jgi:hypothetical protein
METPAPKVQTPTAPPPVATPTVTTLAPKKFNFKVLIFVVLILLVLGALGFFYQIRTFKSGTPSPVKAPEATSKPVSKDYQIFYALLNKAGDLQVFGSDYSGNQQKLFEDKSISRVFSVSPDSTMLAYQSSKTPNALSIRNLKDSTTKNYQLEASASGVIDASWSPHNSELILSISRVGEIGANILKLSLVGGQIQSIGTGLGDLARFWRVDSSAHVFLTDLKKFYSYDWETGNFKVVYDPGQAASLGEFSDIAPNGKGALFNNLVAGKVVLLNFSDQQTSNLLTVRGLNWAIFNDLSSLLYDASPSGHQWSSYDLSTKTSKRLPYAGPYPLIPVNKDFGLINSADATSSGELSVLEYGTGKVTSLYRAKDVDTVVIPLHTLKNI